MTNLLNDIETHGINRGILTAERERSGHLGVIIDPIQGDEIEVKDASIFMIVDGKYPLRPSIVRDADYLSFLLPDGSWAEFARCL